MSDIVEWVLVMDVQPGKADGIQPLIDEMVEATEADEPGALHYEYYRNEGGTRYTVIERYENSEAVMVHLGNLAANFADRFFACFVPVSFVVYGPASDAVKEALSQLGATYEPRVGGFHR